MDTNQIHPAVVLIVDDQAENLQVIGNMLAEENYKKALATNGFEAVDIARKLLPDLIILDVMMPEKDGFSVCQDLKTDERTQNIPIVFVTAKSQLEDKIKGFEFGGVDYITKPFKNEELLARIKTHIELKRSKDLIISQNKKLQKLIDEKNEFLSITAHDLKNPLQVMVGFSKLMEENTNDFSEAEIKEFSRDIRESGEAMYRIITDLLIINKAEEGNLRINSEKFDLNMLISKTVDYLKIRSEEKNINFDIDFCCEQLIIISDSDKVQQIIMNLLSNAIKFSQFNKKIIIRTSVIEEGIDKAAKIEIIDEGPGLTEEDKELLFMKFARLSAVPTNNEGSTRLGLSIVKKFVDYLHGNVYAVSEFGNGTNFVVELPLNGVHE